MNCFFYKWLKLYAHYMIIFHTIISLWITLMYLDLAFFLYLKSIIVWSNLVRGHTSTLNCRMFLLFQKYLNPFYRLAEMRCIGQNATSTTVSHTAKMGTNKTETVINCAQSCDLCDNMTCNAASCQMTSSDAVSMLSTGNMSTMVS